MKYSYEAWKESRRRWKLKISQVIEKAKNVPCFDCGGVFHPICMDFDHRPDETKLFTISGSRGQYGERRIMEEIAKCDVVCANCHRLRTSGRVLIQMVTQRFSPGI